METNKIKVPDFIANFKKREVLSSQKEAYIPPEPAMTPEAMAGAGGMAVDPMAQMGAAAPAMGPGGMPPGMPMMDPAAMGGGMPPVDPMTGMPMGDPAAMGGMPPIDPMTGMPMMDPAAMGGMPPGMPGEMSAGDPNMVQVSLDDLHAFMAEVSGKGGEGESAEGSEAGGESPDAERIGLLEDMMASVFESLGMPVPEGLGGAGAAGAAPAEPAMEPSPQQAPQGAPAQPMPGTMAPIPGMEGPAAMDAGPEALQIPPDFALQPQAMAAPSTEKVSTSKLHDALIRLNTIV